MSGSRAVHRRGLLAAAPALATPAAAQPPTAFPARPIRLIVPFPPGGAVDAWARIAADGMAPLLPQPIILDHRTGAGGMLGAEAVARALPDGHTLLFTADVLVQAPILLRRAPYDPLTDFAPIGKLGSGTVCLVVGPAVPAGVDGLEAFLAWAAGRRLVLGHWAAGGSAHALALALARDRRLEVEHAGYRGEPPMLADLLAGRIHGGFVTTISFGEVLRAGLVRALAAAGPRRLPSLPAVPTLVERGVLRDFSYRGFAGLFAPAGTPAAALAVLETAFRTAALSPAAQASLAAIDTLAEYEPPAVFAATLARAQQEWARLSAELGLAG